MIKAVRHTGVVVRNIEESKFFYCALGFIIDNQSLEEGIYIDTVVGMKNTRLEWIKLKAPDGFLLELLQYHSNPEQKEIVNQKSNQLGCSHLAFSVDNINTTCDSIKELGGSVVNKPVLTDDRKVKVAYCHDNEGNLIELVEVL